MSASKPGDVDVEKQAVMVTSPVDDESDLPPAVAANRKIRYFDDDGVENQLPPRRPTEEFGYAISRRDSTYSIHSVRSFRAGGRTIAPSLALPVTYRTVSFNIAASQERHTAEGRKAKDKASEGSLPLFKYVRS
jgi:hypothetical protein